MIPCAFRPFVPEGGRASDARQPIFDRVNMKGLVLKLRHSISAELEKRGEPELSVLDIINLSIRSKLNRTTQDVLSIFSETYGQPT